MKGTGRLFFMMLSTNMSAAGVVYMCLVILVNTHLNSGKPTFGNRIWCSLFCDDDDYDSSNPTSVEDLLDAMFDPCTDCPKRPRPPNPSVGPMVPLNPAGPMGAMVPIGPGGQPLNFMIPPSNGMNLTMTNTGGAWYMNFVPWAPGLFGPVTPAPAVTPAARVTAAGPVASASAHVSTAATAKGTGTTAKGTSAATTAKP